MCKPVFYFMLSQMNDALGLNNEMEIDEADLQTAFQRRRRSLYVITTLFIYILEYFAFVFFLEHFITTNVQLKINVC